MEVLTKSMGGNTDGESYLRYAGQKEVGHVHDKDGNLYLYELARLRRNTLDPASE